MRIVALAPHLNPTEGWATVPVNVLPRLAEDHDVVALVGEETAPEYADRYDFEVRPVIPSPLETSHPMRVLQTAALLRRSMPPADVVHSFIAYPYLPAAALALLGSRTPVTGTALGTYAVEPLGSWATRRLLTFGYRRAAKVFAISDYTRRRIVEATGVSDTTVLPLGVDLERFGDDDPGDEGYVLSVGAIKERKGQDVLLEAFAAVADEFPDVDLLFVGPVHDPPFRDRLDAIVSDRGIEERVGFLGEVTDQDRLGELYRDCTLFALTPRVVDDNFEGFGLVYLEAAGFAKPSVGTRSGGVPTAVRDGETGLLAPEDDVEGVAAALRELLADPDRRRVLGRNARAHAESNQWDDHVATFVDVLRSDVV